MAMRISLNGHDWKLIWLMPNEWIWRRLWEQRDLDDWSPPVNARWIPATVPGCVQADALAAGLIPDPYVGLNSLQCEWTSQRDWVYVKDFALPPEAKGRRLRLHFEGVDYACHVYLNGRFLGRHEGMYVPFEFEITEAVRWEASNRLMVVVERAPDEQWQIGWTSKVRVWKARFAYGWDWCTRLIPLGIWDDVELRFTGEAFLRDVQVYPDVDVQGNAQVRVQVQLGGDVREDGFAECAILHEGERVAGGELTAGNADVLEETWAVPDPRLWWPNGYGEQPLYRCRVCLRNAQGDLLDEQEKPFGLRRLRWIPNEGAPKEALPYTVEVNGRRIFLKGWNWTPLDHFYGLDLSDRYEHFLRLARNAHVNLLRVWGGGLLEKEVFYDLCDRYGILVWQEFIQSSSGIDNLPPSDPDYLATIESQARAMVLRRRHHPSLAVWSGGNELTDEQYRPLGLDHPAIATLARVVAEADPGRAFLPTSPSGPVFGASLEHLGQMHDVHGPWKYTGVEAHYRLNNEMDALLYSEFGVDGAANLETLRQIAPEEDLWPPSPQNPLWTHHGSWWIQWDQIRDLFGEIDNLESYVRASQWLQAEGLRYAVEANRRRKWRCSGTFPWQFNEAWPNTSCTNCVDYFGRTKPAYWWVRRAYAPLLVSARYDTLAWHGREALQWQIHLNSSLAHRWEGRVSWRLETLTGALLAHGSKEVDMPPDAHTFLGKYRYPLAGAPDFLMLVLWAEDETGQTRCVNHYLFSNAPRPFLAGLLNLPGTRVEVRQEGSTVWVRNAGRIWALGVFLHGVGEDLSDNYLYLAPGEERRLEGAQGGPPSVTGWNVG